jgi:acyl-CoA thioester hydrolase
MEFPEKTTVNSYTVTIRPRYSETDQGEVVHHSVYPVYFELGRTELLRANGLAYKDLETSGVFFVVAELNIRYKQPAKYDEELLLETICSEVTPAKVKHNYKLRRKSDGQLLTEGWSVLVCVDKEGKIRRMPGFMYPE